MSDIGELGQRIARALETMESALPRLPAHDEVAELEDLRIELEAERKASSLLDERVGAMRRKQQEQIDALEARLSDERRDAEGALAETEARLQETQQELEQARAEIKNRDADLARADEKIEAREAELDRVRDEIRRLREALGSQSEVTLQIKRTNGELRATMRSLRDAQTAGLTDAHLINQAVLTELEALRRAHETDRAEMDEILSAMEPILGEMQHA
jgi:chromosome segregation ATPase